MELQANSHGTVLRLYPSPPVLHTPRALLLLRTWNTCLLTRHRLDFLALLDRRRPARARSYAFHNCQPGHRRLDLGGDQLLGC